ncbi:reverse transcriptase domain-containing protein [Artemisia annua]|uniref:Reverse transcriptase domain-containing protein n=1 Tax=Artemisia annua TaxID=35608 RepID=A0A2U1KSV1_ARTAN|nr:reverse transcriptase domain-containing protein [Artemisia annua]
MGGLARRMKWIRTWSPLLATRYVGISLVGIWIPLYFGKFFPVLIIRLEQVWDLTCSCLFELIVPFDGNIWGRVAAMGMTCEDFNALMVEEFCPSNEMQKLEEELWNHTMVGTNHAGYTDKFHELARMVPHLVTPESKRIDSRLSGNNFYGSGWKW